MLSPNSTTALPIHIFHLYPAPKRLTSMKFHPYWLVLNTHLTRNYNSDLDVIHSFSFKDRVDYFSIYIVTLIITIPHDGN